MKIEERENGKYIIIEKNDNIKLAIPSTLSTIIIKSVEGEGLLEISGDSSIISQIKGIGMLEKVEIIPNTLSEEIIEKCEKWLDIFKKTHDELRKLVLTDKYRDQDVTLCFECYDSFSFENKNCKERGLGLKLTRYGNTIVNGVAIDVDIKNDDVFAYLYASTLDYYLKENCMQKKVNLDEFNYCLTSSIKKEEGKVNPIVAHLSSFNNDCEELVISLIMANNVGMPTDSLLSKYRNRICSQQIYDNLDYSIEQSSKQYEYISKM
jgi:hypothetical protein